MKNAFLNSFQLILFGFALPFKIWIISKNKLSTQDNPIDDLLDDQYIVTSWIDWVIDCFIFLLYPIGLFVVLILCFVTGGYAPLLAMIPMYFFTLFISYVRELGGSLMLMHMNVRNIEKNTHK